MRRSEGRRASPRRRPESVAEGGDARRPASAAAAPATADAGTVRGRTIVHSGVRLRACVVFASLRGFTRLAGKLEPTRVVQLLDEYFTAMTDVAVAHRAMIDNVLGDTLVLLYGVPTPRKDDPLRAVRTAVDMQRAFLALRNRWLSAGESRVGPLGLSIGIASGEVLIASLRPAAWLDYTAVGEPLETAARLCAAARPAESLIDEATYTSVYTRLDGELVFSSRGSSGRKAANTAYRVQPRRAGLRVVPRRAVVDPVCGSAVDTRGAVRRRIAGDTLYFCSPVCARRFAEDPDRFA